MKKYLLSLLGVSCLVASTTAQSVVAIDRNRVQDRTIERTDAVPVPYDGIKPQKVRNDITLTDISSSVNIFSVLMAQQHCLDYQPDLDAFMFTNRGNPGVIATGNELINSISTDDGATFSSEIGLANTTILRRYPSGVIFNPAGNTQMDNAFRLLAGPRTESNLWTKSYFGSSTFGNQFASEKMVDNNTGHELIVRHGLSVDPSGIAHVCGMAYSTNSQNYATFGQGIVMRGVFNSATNQFDWTEQTLAPEVNHASDQTWDLAISDINVAFSPDGQVGYVTFVGADTRSGADLCSYQPIVYKSTDRGLTWEMMAYLNLKNHPALVEYLPGLNRDFSIVKPSVSETDMVVDAAGNLHLMMVCKGASSDHPDSLGYVYNADMGTVFEMFNVNQGDDWLIQYIDTLRTDYVKAEESGYGIGDNAVGWDHRLQASRSADGNFVFALWTDSDPEFFGVEINLYPDLHGWARDVVNNTYTLPVDFTGGSDTWGDNNFHYFAPVVKKTTDGWMLPVTITDIRVTNDPDQAVFHKFVHGISFDDADFVITAAPVNPGSEATVNIYPNPVNDLMNIQLGHQCGEEAVVEVFDLSGSIISSTTARFLPKDAATISLNTAGMAGGVYFVRVSSGSWSVVKKAVVDHVR